MAEMPPERLAEIRERMDGATAGPWAVRDLFVVAPDDVYVADCEWLADTDEEWAEFGRNTLFMAAARQDVPDLLAEVERLHAVLERERTHAAAWRVQYDLLSGKATRYRQVWQNARARAARMRAERDDIAGQVERVRDLDLHQGSVHFPDECRRDCPGCAVTAALDGTEADRG